MEALTATFNIFGSNLLQGLLLLCFSPLIAGIVNKVKAILQKRKGASIIQEYFDIYKWWCKPTLLTPYTGKIFIIAPVIYFVTSLAAAVMVPGFLRGQLSIGDAFVFVYILALGRFFMTLSSLDAGTAFGGMGGSREIYISVLVEPAVMLAILINSLRYHTTTLSQMTIDYSQPFFTISTVFACVAFFLVMIAENGRLPVDNPDTHLELTMIHECMTLEYSGRLLALIHLGSMLKLLVFLTLFGALYLPVPVPLPMKILGGACLVGLVEILNNKMRLFKVRIYLGAALLLLLLAIIAE